MVNRLIIYSIAVILFGCTEKEVALFKLVPATTTGIQFSNDLDESDDLNILDYLYFYNGGGLAVGDINNDGLPDVFISGNLVPNALYLNKGNLQFEDISEKAGITGNSSWNTGAVMGDVNGDGLLDIYVCAVVGLNGFNGHNELYINKGNGAFEERAAAYNVDFESYSSNAVFLDYDLDGDLDMYLLNHAVHTPESFGKAALRLERNYETGDKLLRNDNGVFVDVSDAAGIFGGINGYGLGIAVSDFNLDGYPDIFVGNDFHEDDYYYLNNGDGTFKESLRTSFGHTSRFSMGNDVVDLNHDGLPDLFSLDMLPDNEKVLKTSEGDNNIQIERLRTSVYGYHHQFSRNMLFLNQPDGTFSETALQNGVAATDWSWSALFADFNQDGEQDLFVSNGIPKRPNDLDYINFVSSDNIRNKINNTNLVDQKALELMPSGKVANRIFKGTKSTAFKDMSASWIPQEASVSGATSYADLDNDGDLDLVVNNLNAPISILENLTDTKSNYLKIALRYKDQNPFGVGTKVYSYINGVFQLKELFTVRGFQASSQPIVHFGYGQETQVDSIKIVWPDKTYQTIKNVAVNQHLEVTYAGTKPHSYNTSKKKPTDLFKKIPTNFGIDFNHKEDSYTDYNRQKLIPYQVSDRGPATSIGDINGDGKDDVYFGGSKYIPAAIYLQQDSTFTLTKFPSIQKDSIKEVVTSLLRDFNNDGSNDLLVGAGGGDFYNKVKPLTESYYRSSKDTILSPVDFPKHYANTAVLLSIDYDNDGDLDIFIGNQSISGDFGLLPDSCLLNNDKGVFTKVADTPFANLGMVTDAIAEDFNGDGTVDIIVVGEWMAPLFFKNIAGKFSSSEVLDNNKLKGLYESIAAFDIDNDGDKDYLLGNWGLNSKFKATEDHPMNMYYGDFDNNGATETIVATAKNGDYYPIDGLKDLSEQLVFLRKRFKDYASFAGKPIAQIFDKMQLQNTKILEVHNLASGYLENNKGIFTFVPFVPKLQSAPILDFLVADFDKDSKNEVLVGGNYLGMKPYHGRYDSFSGAIIKDENTVLLGTEIGLDFMFKSVRHMNIFSKKNVPYLLVTMNNGDAQVYEFAK